jgi:hypothetical protein
MSFAVFAAPTAVSNLVVDLGRYWPPKFSSAAIAPSDSITIKLKRLDRTTMATTNNTDAPKYVRLMAQCPHCDRDFRKDKIKDHIAYCGQKNTSTE